MLLRNGLGWHPPQTAAHIHIRQVKSVWGIGMLSQGHMGAPLYHSTSQVGNRFWNALSFVEGKWWKNILVEVDIKLRLLPTSILDTYKLFEVLLCCLKGIWVHPFIVPLGKLAQDFGILVPCGVEMWLSHRQGVYPYIIPPTSLAPDFGALDHLWSWNDANTSWLRLTPPLNVSHIHTSEVTV